MKNVLTILFALLSISIFGQNSLFVGVVASKADNETETINTISFSNPQDTVCKVWRSGIEYTGTITPKTGQTVTKWAIIEHLGRDTVASGTGTSVTATMNFVHIDSTVFDLYAIMSGLGGDTLMLPAEIFVDEVDDGIYDETWSSAGGHDMAWTNRPGYKIKITGAISGQVNAWWLRSDDPTNPVRIIVDDATISSATWNFTTTAFKNVIIDGCTSTTYGGTLIKTGAGLNQAYQHTMHEDATHRSGSMIIRGLDIDGADIAGTGNTGVRIVPQRDATNNEASVAMPYLLMHNIRVRGTHEEGVYIGSSSDALSGGNGYTRITRGLFYNFDVDSTGNEAFQIGTIDNWELARSRLSNSGLRDQNGHENLLQLSNGCVNGDVYMNFFDQGTHNTVAFFQGRTGLQNEIHANVMYTLGKDADGGGNFWGRSDDHDTETELYYSVYNNDFIWTAGASWFTLYENTDIWNKFWAVGNIIVGATTTDFENGNGFTASHVEMENLKYTTANISSVGFVNAAGKDYHLSSLASPAFATFTTYTPTKTSVFKDYDYEGIKFKLPVYGAFSGYELQNE